jgi:ribosomal protein S18 acetylase RimI-like enzyme
MPGPSTLEFRGMAAKVVEPSLSQVLAFCGEDPVERVFLEDIARRGLGSFSAVEENGSVTAVAHTGVNVVPSGRGCAAFASLLGDGRERMIIGDEHAVGELWEAARRRLPRAREDRPGQPVFVLDRAPESGETDVRPATPDDLDLLVPACAAAHAEELGTDPLEHDPEGFRWRTRAQIEEGRSWIWERDGVILFKAEASAWTPSAVQLQQVWVDPAVRNRGNGKRGMRDLCRLLLDEVPCVCLFVRPENVPAISVYERIGMTRRGTYRSVLL